MKEHRKLAADFIRSQSYATVATTCKGVPQAATVAFSECNDFEIIFSTYNTTRKYKNLKEDPHIAIVIGWDEAITVQLEGTAEELSGDLLKECKKIHVTKNPGSEVYADLPYNRYFKVIPNWIRYTDISKDSEFVIEIPV